MTKTKSFDAICISNNVEVNLYVKNGERVRFEFESKTVTWYNNFWRKDNGHIGQKVNEFDNVKYSITKENGNVISDWQIDNIFGKGNTDLKLMFVKI